MQTPDAIPVPALPSTLVGPGIPLPASALAPPAPEPVALAAAITGIAPPPIPTMSRVVEQRTAYWQNVVREMLAAFAILAHRMPQITDGRVSIVTSLGERIPLAGVEPLFPCTVVSDPRERQLCITVQCTVFNIRTPLGEVVTVPLHEITSVRVLSDELLRELEAAFNESGAKPENEPFGFAAFTSLAKQTESKSRDSVRA